MDTPTSGQQKFLDACSRIGDVLGTVLGSVIVIMTYSAIGLFVILWSMKLSCDIYDDLIVGLLRDHATIASVTATLLTFIIMWWGLLLVLWMKHLITDLTS